MSKSTIGLLIATAAVFIFAVVTQSRMAAGVGALLLGVVIALAMIRNRKAPRSNYAEAEAGARELREEKALEREKTVDL